MDFEQYKTDVMNFFKNNLPTYIDSINAEKTDIVVPKPSSYQMGYPTLQPNANLWVFKQEYNFEIESNKSMVMNNDLTCFVTVSGYNDETLEKIVQRYKEAVFNCVASDMALGGLCSLAYITNIKDWPGLVEAANMVAVEFHISTVNYLTIKD